MLYRECMIIVRGFYHLLDFDYNALGIHVRLCQNWVISYYSICKASRTTAPNNIWCVCSIDHVERTI